MIRDIPKLNRHFDVLVVGGGIYGAWVAYDAALRGLRVALVEKNDWASGTSSASTKLIHGGLRYLESFDFGLVQKSLRERNMLLECAPHRVTTVRFNIKTDSPWQRLKCRIGIHLYDFLAKTKTRKGLSYLDGQTDDARMVLELVDGALQVGAVCINYCEFLEGSLFVDGQTLTPSYDYLIDTTGRWSKERGRLTKGVHLVMPKDSDEATLSIKKDGRVVFTVPWYERTLLGTTDTEYNGDIDNVMVEQEDIDYLLEGTQWTEKDIINSYAGIRVLKSSESATRDWEFIREGNTLYSVGGKITSAREDASVLVDQICDKSCKTFNRKFPWYTEDVYPMEQYGIDEECGRYLVRRYGSKVPVILAIIAKTPYLSKRITTDLPFIKAELIYCLKYEMVIKEEDLLRRRIPLNILED